MVCEKYNTGAAVIKSLQWRTPCVVNWSTLYPSTPENFRATKPVLVTDRGLKFAFLFTYIELFPKTLRRNQENFKIFQMFSTTTVYNCLCSSTLCIYTLLADIYAESFNSQLVTGFSTCVTRNKHESAYNDRNW